MMQIVFLYFLLFCTTVIANPLKKSYKHYHQDPAVQRFRRYIQIDTSLEENLKYAVDFWRIQASELSLPISVYEPDGLSICVITWEGADPTLPSIMLNSHMDVVPADEECSHKKTVEGGDEDTCHVYECCLRGQPRDCENLVTEWKYPPNSAYIDENGDIYGRGTQDTKDVSIQYLEAIRRLKQDNITLQRTLHITLMPDEEVGGFKGIKSFIDTREFKELNVGFALDEGMSSPDNTLFALYEDRRPWQMKFTVHGESGHGHTIPDESAMEKARRLINVIMDYREQMKDLMRTKDKLDYGAYSSVNINIINGGLMLPNVIPSTYSLVVDMRLSSASDATEVEEMVNSWVAEAGNGTEISYIRRDDVSASTRLDESNPYWIAVQHSVTNMGMTIVPIVCPATSDMLVLRNRGIPAVGFTPKTNIASRIHGKDEYTHVETFLRGIDIYVEILKGLGNVPFHKPSDENYTGSSL